MKEQRETRMNKRVELRSYIAEVLETLPPGHKQLLFFEDRRKPALPCWVYNWDTGTLPPSADGMSFSILDVYQSLSVSGWSLNRPGEIISSEGIRALIRQTREGQALIRITQYDAHSRNVKLFVYGPP